MVWLSHSTQPRHLINKLLFKTITHKEQWKKQLRVLFKIYWSKETLNLSFIIHKYALDSRQLVTIRTQLRSLLNLLLHLRPKLIISALKLNPQNLTSICLVYQGNIVRFLKLVLKSQIIIWLTEISWTSYLKFLRRFLIQSSTEI